MSIGQVERRKGFSATENRDKEKKPDDDHDCDHGDDGDDFCEFVRCT